jgi:hypothetical protein
LKHDPNEASAPPIAGDRDRETERERQRDREIERANTRQ